MNYRIACYGDMSYFRDSEEGAVRVAFELMKKNGCGYIARKTGEIWVMIARYEPWYGVVMIGAKK